MRSTRRHGFGSTRECPQHIQAAETGLVFPSCLSAGAPKLVCTPVCLHFVDGLLLQKAFLLDVVPLTYFLFYCLCFGC